MRKHLLLIPLVLFAGDLYNITGKVMDYHTGKPIDKASVVIMNTPWSTITDVDGEYHCWGLPPTGSSVYATADGYDTLVYLSTKVWGVPLTKHFDFKIKLLATSLVNHQIDSTKLHEYGTLMGEVTDEVTSHHIGGVALTLERTFNLRQNYRIKTR